MQMFVVFLLLLLLIILAVACRRPHRQGFGSSCFVLDSQLPPRVLGEV
jgi:hypothetical protein